jgi:hypothetical protein
MTFLLTTLQTGDEEVGHLLRSCLPITVSPPHPDSSVWGIDREFISKTRHVSGHLVTWQGETLRTRCKTLILRAFFARSMYRASIPHPSLDGEEIIYGHCTATPPGPVTQPVSIKECEVGNPASCPGDTICPFERSVCVTEFSCDAPCSSDANCGAGEICIVTPCGTGGFRCALVAAI